MIRKHRGNIIFFAVLAVVVAAVYFARTSRHFETVAPQIEVADVSFWNLKWQIPVKITDESGVKSYQVLLIHGESETQLLAKNSDKREISFNLPIPRININDGDTIRYKIIAKDGSKSHFFKGNTAEREVTLTIDTKPPSIKIVAMSNIITRGGVAAVVFQAEDENLANISLSNGSESLLAFKFLKEGYYACIIPWNLRNQHFQATIIAQDKARNTKKSNINYTKYARNYRTSNITLKPSFLERKIAEIIENAADSANFAANLGGAKAPNLADSPNPAAATQPNPAANLAPANLANPAANPSTAPQIEAFRFVNETLRGRDSARIRDAILNLAENGEAANFNVFKPLENAVIVGLFGDYRRYFFEKEQVGESYHLGIDLASQKHAKIAANNDGRVVFAAPLSVYGNAVIIDHGFGVSSLYSHLSESFVREGDFLRVGDTIGRTGESGLAFGDHLHFGLLVQGVFVLTPEWLDSRYLKIAINDVFKDARDIIEAR